MERLGRIQRALKAPKDQVNNFGKYRYRKAEDILEAVKPLLEQDNLSIVLCDDIKEVAGKWFLIATATLYAADGKEIASSHAFAEMCAHAGMSAEQSTGAASSYARKYALNGLFAIDDSKDDPDAIEQPKAPAPAPAAPAKPAQTPAPTHTQAQIDAAVKKAQECTNVEDLAKVWGAHKDMQKIPAFREAVSQRGEQLKQNQ